MTEIILRVTPCMYNSFQLKLPLERKRKFLQINYLSKIRKKKVFSRHTAEQDYYYFLCKYNLQLQEYISRQLT